MPLTVATVNTDVSTINTRTQPAVAPKYHVTAAEKAEIVSDIEAIFGDSLTNVPDSLVDLGTNGGVIKTDVDGGLHQVNEVSIIADL